MSDILRDCERKVAEAEVPQALSGKAVAASRLAGPLGRFARPKSEPAPAPANASFETSTPVVRKSQLKKRRIALRPNRLRSSSQRTADKRRKQTAEQKAEDKNRFQRPEQKEKERKRKARPEDVEADRKRQQRYRAARKGGGRAHIQRASANRQHETTHPRGTWQEAAATIAGEEGAPSLKVLPPSYVGLNDKTCLWHIGQMYGFLHEVRWCTCVRCWLAWCHAPLDYAFDKVPSETGQERQWFQQSHSKILCGDASTKTLDRWMLDYDGEARPIR